MWPQSDLIMFEPHYVISFFSWTSSIVKLLDFLTVDTLLVNDTHIWHFDTWLLAESTSAHHRAIFDIFTRAKEYQALWVCYCSGDWDIVCFQWQIPDKICLLSNLHINIPYSKWQHNLGQKLVILISAFRIFVGILQNINLFVNKILIIFAHAIFRLLKGRNQIYLNSSWISLQIHGSL